MVPLYLDRLEFLGFDFVMLQKENYKALLPIYITNTQGSEHSDFLPVARASKLFYPDCIKTGLSDKGIQFLSWTM